MHGTPSIGEKNTYHTVQIHAFQNSLKAIDFDQPNQKLTEALLVTQLPYEIALKNLSTDTMKCNPHHKTL